MGLWQGRRDSNTRPTVLETATLPTELRPYATIYYHFNRTKSIICAQFVKIKNANSPPNSSHSIILYRALFVFTSANRAARSRRVHSFKFICYNRYSGARVVRLRNRLFHRTNAVAFAVDDMRHNHIATVSNAVQFAYLRRALAHDGRAPLRNAPIRL